MRAKRLQKIAEPETWAQSDIGRKRIKDMVIKNPFGLILPDFKHPHQDPTSQHVTIFYLEVGPDLAAEFLARSENVRAPNPDHVVKLAEEMAQGWSRGTKREGEQEAVNDIRERGYGKRLHVQAHRG